MQQLHDRVVFEPTRINEMTKLERKKSMESLILLNKKRYKTTKAIMCANSSTQ